MNESSTIKYPGFDCELTFLDKELIMNEKLFSKLMIASQEKSNYCISSLH